MGKKGTSLPDDWKLPDEWRAYALRSGLSDKEIDIEEFNFKMYWLGAAENATKSDWERPWKDWCIRRLLNLNMPDKKKIERMDKRTKKTVMTYNMNEERIKKLNRIAKDLREEEEQLILYIRATRDCFSKTKEENMEHLLRCLMQKREWFEGYICGYRRVIFENRDTSKEAQEAMEKKMEKNKEITAIPEEIYIEESEFKQINVRFPQMPCGE